MDAHEIKAICAQVLADRKRKKAPVDAPRPFRFTGGRFVRRVEDLDAAALRQLVAVGRDGVGVQFGPEALIAGQDGEEEESLYGLETWDVVDAKGALACRVWMFGTDNGCVFRGDTLEIVAGVSQGGVDSADKALVKDLISARKALAREDLPKKSCIRCFGG